MPLMVVGCVLCNAMYQCCIYRNINWVLWHSVWCRCFCLARGFSCCVLLDSWPHRRVFLTSRMLDFCKLESWGFWLLRHSWGWSPALFWFAFLSSNSGSVVLVEALTTNLVVGYHLVSLSTVIKVGGHS